MFPSNIIIIKYLFSVFHYSTNPKIEQHTKARPDILHIIK